MLLALIDDFAYAVLNDASPSLVMDDCSATRPSGGGVFTIPSTERCWGGVWRRAGRRPSIVRPNDATHAGASFGRRTRARCIGNMIARERARRDPRENVPRARRRRNCRLARGPLEGLFGGVRAPTRVARIPKSRDATRNAP